MGPPKAKAPYSPDGSQPPAPPPPEPAPVAPPPPEIPAAAHEAAVAPEDAAQLPELSLPKEEEKPPAEEKVETKPPEGSEIVKPPVKDEADGEGAPIASGEDANPGVKDLVAPKDETEQPKGRWRDKGSTAGSSGQDPDAMLEVLEKRFEEQRKKTVKAWESG